MHYATKFLNQKMPFLALLFSIILLFFNTSLFAEEILNEGLTYLRHSEKNHVIHILTIDPTLYRFQLVKAHNQTFGRETVESIAKRKNAIAAINGGFFEMGDSDDGRPSGTLIINGKWVSLAKGERALLTLSENGFSIKNAETKINLVINGRTIQPDKVNQFAKNNEIVLYNSHFGPNTLTPYNRKEISIDENNIIKEIILHGDNPIPIEGLIVSLPQEFNTDFVKSKQLIKINHSFTSKEDNDNHRSLPQNTLMGIPLLIKSGKSVVELSNSQNNTTFSQSAHARSAFGIKPDGKIVWVVVEHKYKQPISKITIGEIQDLLKAKGYSRKQMDEITFSTILPMMQEKHSDPAVIGLSLSELANFMIDLGCIEAINLDGGGSSSLYLNGKTVNLPVGDADEAMGKIKLRPVSDAIVITKK